MAPKFSTTPSVDKWWQNAYANSDHIHVQYEFDFEGEPVVANKTILRMKNTYGTFKFRCLAHNIQTDRTWIECIDNKSGAWRAFPVDKLKGIVKPKKSRRKKVEKVQTN